MQEIHHWESPHKKKYIQGLTYRDKVNMANNHKLNAFFITMMQKLMRGTNMEKALLKETNDLTKISQQ